MEIKFIAIDQIKPSEYNPRYITDDMLQKLKNSITEFGFVVPLIVNSDNVLIGGHQRLRAAAELGLTELPCVEVTLTKEQEKILNIALNKITGEWDEAKLIEALQQVDDIDLTGFSQAEFETIKNRLSEENATITDETGETKVDNSFKLSFYISDETVYNGLREFFGSRPDISKLQYLISKFEVAKNGN